jgi:hypothetical protein
MQKHLLKILVVAAIALIGVFFLLKRTPQQASKPKTPVDFLTKLQVEELRQGEGAVVKASDRVRIHYVEWIMAGGKMVDSTYQRMSPSEIALNSADVISGLKNGIIGMRRGGKRKLVIPPDLAYGKQSVGLIPPNSHLVFEVEVLDILPSTMAVSSSTSTASTPNSSERAIIKVPTKLKKAGK